MSVAEEQFASRIKGHKCIRLLVQQAWHRGELSDEWNVLFLELEDGSYVRFFFDAGVFFWRDEPPSLPESFDDFEFRLNEPHISSVLRGREVLAASFGPLPSGGRVLGLIFEGTVGFYLHNVHDRTSVVFG